jgi:hypothetical protein
MRVFMESGAEQSECKAPSDVKNRPKVELKKGRDGFIMPDLKVGLWFEN